MSIKIKSVEPAPRITRIELTPVLIPFLEIVREAMRKSGGLGMAIPAEEEWPGVDCAVCKLTDEAGNAGLGESYVWWPETGTSPDQIIDVIKSALSRYILGESPFNAGKTKNRMDCNVARSEVAKGLLDMACYDLMGKVLKLPVCEMLGGRARDIPLTALVPLIEAEEMAALAGSFYESGYRTIRLKLGHFIEEDIQIVSSVRRRLGDNARLRVDYNQAYNPRKAVSAINAIEQYGIDVAEQPVRAGDFAGMAYVQRRVNMPLMAHEGCFSMDDIITLKKLGGIGVVAINTERPGGVTAALQAFDFAKRHRMGIIIHNQSPGISSAVLIHLAAAHFESLGHDIELFGHVMLEDDLILEPINYAGGKARVPRGTGWGVELDEAALDKYRTGPTVKIALP